MAKSDNLGSSSRYLNIKNLHPFITRLASDLTSPGGKDDLPPGSWRWQLEYTQVALISLSGTSLSRSALIVADGNLNASIYRIPLACGGCLWGSSSLGGDEICPVLGRLAAGVVSLAVVGFPAVYSESLVGKCHEKYGIRYMESGWWNLIPLDLV